MRTKLSIDNIPEIKKCFKDGLTVRQAAEKMSVSRMTMDRFCIKHKIERPKYVQSSETKDKRAEAIREAHKNDPTLTARKTKGIISRNKVNKGKTFDEIYDAKTAAKIKKSAIDANTGRKASLSTRQKMSKSRKGKIFSQEWRKNISIARKKGIANGTIKISKRAGCGKGGFKPDIGHYVRSTYEHYFAQQLQSQGIRYFYEPKTFDIVVDGEQTTYTPDFYISQEDRWIEIKNTYNATNLGFTKKFAAFQEQYPDEDVELIIGDRSWIPQT
tara:strand:- start:2886 stop:3701 length:816 start_codon:yes stop_codon:yes gene_type:complete